MTLLFFYLFIALFVSFLCSITEAVLLSTPISFLKAKEENSKKAATQMVQLKNNIDRSLSAILSLNTIAHTVGAAGVGAQAIKVFGDAYFGIVSAIMTILILIFTEIIPKTIGALYWRELALGSGYIIRLMIIITYPLVIFSALITKIISSQSPTHTMSKEELSALANIGVKEGLFGEKENKIIQNLIWLNKVKISEIMTPRVVASIADEDMTLDDFMKNKDYLRFSRIPVFSEIEDTISGYVFRQTVFEKLAQDHTDLRLKDIKRKIVVIPRTRALLGAWETLISEKEHIAVVVDEYGGMDGIVTMEDIIETLLGFEIVDEKDTITDMQQYARERWRQVQNKNRIKYSNNFENE